ncbi:FAD-binding oxidoreductase [Herminiimonas fonticola]|uniref:D-lactate dehydrogenase (Cytochrome) n=1 Tax=Herminiimonas fonticola TaxID=303380 RepID=A0A4V3BV79_9BURK|nr:FAD-binding oxidoreductase [Herminiimonas fonticola]RBA24059.1 FAD/FMN-containing dehydrogenase [Herminiimonas fonticola]TDN90058.1 D-lactate dehydrogenase (cytochrome) [Herminiimonas fonticola]
MTAFLDACRHTIGAQYVSIDAEQNAPYLIDARRRFTGTACAVVKPGSTEEVAAIVRLCNQFKVPVVPQGGNTGLVLGSVPDDSGTAIVLSLTRLNQIRTIDPVNNTMTVESGCILHNIQQAAEGADRLFPLSLGSEGSCTIGGNLSSNAGGTAVLRYGNARELCLGLEVVTPQGDIWHGLRGLRKDNTGYDLRDLYIGAEGTLGIITAAVIKLFPQPKATRTALLALRSADDALRLLTLAQKKCNAALTGFELMSGFCMTLVSRHFPQMRLSFKEAHAQYVLLELSDSESDEHANTLLENLICDALQQGIVQDAIIATSIAQSKALWTVREHIPLAQAAEGKNIKHDVSLPISVIGDFISETDRLVREAFPGVRIVTFGHLGDGNLHYNIAHPEHDTEDSFLMQQAAINRIVHDSVHSFDGSISAEHGIGALKREEILRYKSEIEMNLMRTIKHALDPLNIMNPGKLIQD